MDNLTFNLVCSIILLELELVKLKLQLKQLCSMLYILFLTSGFVCVLAAPFDLGLGDSAFASLAGDVALSFISPLFSLFLSRPVSCFLAGS